MTDFTRLDLPSPLAMRTDAALRCTTCRGTFRAFDRGAPCPACGGPSVAASEPLPPLAETARVPALLVDGDPALTRLIEFQRKAPEKMRSAEVRLAELRGKRTKLAARSAEALAKAAAGLIPRKDADMAVEAVAAANREIDAATREFDDAVAGISAVAGTIAERMAARRAALAQEAAAAARKVRDDLAPHVEAVLAILERAEHQARMLRPALAIRPLVNGRDEYPRELTAYGPVLGVLDPPHRHEIVASLERLQRILAALR